MNKEVVGSLAWGIGIVVLALGATYMRKTGHLEAETVTRIVMCATGLMVAWFGNRMPKNFVPAAGARQVSRVGGWSLAISGLVYAALWLVAPREWAVIGGTLAILIGMAVTVGYCLSIRGKLRNPTRHS